MPDSGNDGRMGILSITIWSGFNRAIGKRAAVGTLGATALVALGNASCERESAPETSVGASALGTDQAATAVGLALRVEDGQGRPVSVRAGQIFYLNQLDLRAAVVSSVDRGVEGLALEGDFADLDWTDVEQRDEDFLVLPNPDGTFTRRRFYRNAQWMRKLSWFELRQVDAGGNRTAPPVRVQVGPESHATGHEAFFVRRMRAIQFANDCPEPRDCTGAQAFLEEALIELRYSTATDNTFEVHPDTTAFELRWSQLGDRTYVIPVEQVPHPAFDYGAAAEIAPVTPPGPDGSYPPGSAVTFQLTLRDGSGNRLHEPGALPSYMDATFGFDASGIKYYEGFFEPVATYYRRKHLERMMNVEIVGPVQNVQPIRSFLELDDFFLGDTIQAATLERDGLYSEITVFPRAPDLFAGAFDPEHAAWMQPVSDSWTFQLPDNAPSGTYLVTVKGRRAFLGEDIPYSATLEIQVGSPERTQAHLDTGPCTSCHSGDTSLANVLHAIDNRATCTGCHSPLGFEYDSPVFVRTHFIHSRSERFEAPPQRCSSCHLTEESIQRTSKAACLSCHTSYPPDHVVAFGPIENPYVGGARESFDNCTTTCHTAHPGSKL
jgi:predicted CXXCH cytochrome family protein